MCENCGESLSTLKRCTTNLGHVYPEGLVQIYVEADLEDALWGFDPFLKASVGHAGECALAEQASEIAFHAI